MKRGFVLNNMIRRHDDHHRVIATDTRQQRRQSQCRRGIAAKRLKQNRRRGNPSLPQRMTGWRVMELFNGD